MNRKQRETLEDILNDKTSGSSEIVRKINNYFLQLINDKAALKNSIRILQPKLNQFASVNSYLKYFKQLISDGDLQSQINFILSYEKNEEIKIQLMTKKFTNRYKNISKILTLSRSGTLLKVFEILNRKNPQLKITVLESRPAFEGKLMAKSLLKSGIKVELIPDAMMGIYVNKIDAVLIGADKILANGNVVNKIGSSALAILCKNFKKPLLVIAAKSKLSGNMNFNSKKENGKEVWDFHHKCLTVTNFYFEEIDKKLITEIISE